MPNMKKNETAAFKVAECVFYALNNLEQGSIKDALLRTPSFSFCHLKCKLCRPWLCLSKHRFSKAVHASNIFIS